MDQSETTPLRLEKRNERNNEESEQSIRLNNKEDICRPPPRPLSSDEREPGVHSTYAFLQQWPEAQRYHAGARGVGKAASLICDAFLGRVIFDQGTHGFDPYLPENNLFLNRLSIVCGRIISNRVFQRVLKVAAWSLVCLTFLEPPRWCKHFVLDNSDEVVGCSVAMTLSGPPAEDPTSESVAVDYYPNMGSILVNERQSKFIELAVVFLLLLYMVLSMARDGLSFRIYFRKGSRRWTRLARIVSVAAILFGRTMFDMGPLPHLFRIIIAISFSMGAQRELTNLLKMLPEVVNILALLFVLIVFYGWMGVLAFYDSAEGEHFSSLVEACWTLWICVTTANYPDVMMAGYNENRLVALYFVSFMMITFFFMMNVILASVVNKYDKLDAERVVTYHSRVADDLKRAFQLLDTEQKGVIERETIMALFVVLNDDFPQLRHISDDDTKLLFGFLDKDGSNSISEAEFMNFCNVMLLQFEHSSLYTTWIETVFPDFYLGTTWQRVTALVTSERFEAGMEVVLILNAIVVGVQSYPMLVGQAVNMDESYTDGAIDTIWEAMETLFTVIYCFEMILKILVNGWRRFSHSMRNLFDLLITILAILATVYVYFPNEFSDSRLIRYVVMSRVLRLARLLAAMKPFQIISYTWIQILPATSRVFVLLFLIMCAFSTLGMFFFGGMISRDPSNPLSSLIVGTDFSDNEYWANNFNDMFSGMNVLFNLLVVNNWTECADGFEAVTKTKWTRLFFLFFHVFGVILVNNIVLAVVINAFMDQWQKIHESSTMEDVTGEAVIVGRTAMFDAKEVTGTKTELTGKYFAKISRTSQLGQHETFKSAFKRSNSSETTEEVVNYLQHLPDAVNSSKR